MARFKVVADADNNTATLLGMTGAGGADAAMYGKDISVFVRGFAGKDDLDTFNIFVGVNSPHSPYARQVFIGKVVTSVDGYPIFVPVGD